MFKKFALFFVFGATVLSGFYWYVNFKNLSSAVSVYAVFDQSKVGEANMIGAIYQVLPKVCDTWSFVTMTPQHIESSLAQDKAGTRVIITAGQFGVKFLKSLTPLKRVKVLLCTHQWFDGIKNLHDIFIAMPEHVIDADVQKIAQQQNLTLIPTQGVLHTMSAEALADEDISAIHLTDAKIGLILGGDAETPAGAWQVFSIENARKLASEVVEFQKRTGDKLLITNGPRTGRSVTAHKTEELDVISTAFLRMLHEAGLKQGTDFEFFNFQFGKPSALKAVMKIVLNNKGFMIVPGESTSSISEILAVMPASIYEHDAMNEQHRAFVEKLTRSHSAALWPLVPDSALMKAYAPLPSEAVNVVAAFLK
ncbi:MAG: hypothetical protein WCJ92_00405 [Alphaproteobacteria bacterium]